MTNEYEMSRRFTHQRPEPKGPPPTKRPLLGMDAKDVGGPDELRKAADEVNMYRGQPIDGIILAVVKMQAAADAWVAQIAGYENELSGHRAWRDACEAELATLRKRLEASVPLLLRAQAVQDNKMVYSQAFCWWCGGLKHPMTEQHSTYCAGARYFANLADDEEPQRLLPWDEYVKKVRAAAAGEK